MNYKKEVKKLIDKIKEDQADHLKFNADSVYKSVAESSTFNDAFIDASRAVINELKTALHGIEQIEDHFNSPDQPQKAS